MQSQFNLISKQQCVKAELSGLSFQDMVDESDSDRRKALRDLFATIETRITLCPRDWRNESNKVDFLRNALLTEDWARQHLCRIGKGTHFRELQTQLASALQIHEEVLARSGNSSKAGPPASSASKPTIFFTAPKYTKRVTKKLFPGSDQDRSCWNCGRAGHRHVRCRKPLNPAVIAARKAEFLEKKKAARVASVYSTNWCKDSKTSSTSSLVTPKLLLLILVMDLMRALISTLSLRTPNPSKK